MKGKNKYKVGDKIKFNPNVRWSNVYIRGVDFLLQLSVMGTPRIVKIQFGGQRGVDGYHYPIIYIVNVGNAGNRLWAPEKFIKNKVEE